MINDEMQFKDMKNHSKWTN